MTKQINLLVIKPDCPTCSNYEGPERLCIPELMGNLMKKDGSCENFLPVGWQDYNYIDNVWYKK